MPFFAVNGIEACTHAVKVAFWVISVVLVVYAIGIFAIGTPLNLT